MFEGLRPVRATGSCYGTDMVFIVEVRLCLKTPGFCLSGTLLVYEDSIHIIMTV